MKSLVERMIMHAKVTQANANWKVEENVWKLAYMRETYRSNGHSTTEHHLEEDLKEGADEGSAQHRTRGTEAASLDGRAGREEASRNAIEGKKEQLDPKQKVEDTDVGEKRGSLVTKDLEVRSVRKDRGVSKEEAKGVVVEEGEEHEVPIGEGEDAEEDDGVGGEGDIHERDEVEQLVGVEEHPEWLKRDVPE